jgi:putative tricarboxylic transport membrane protein
MLGAPEYFSLMVLALAAVTAVISGSAAKGLASLCLGLLLGSVGMDPQNGQPRFTFGILELLDGIDTTIVAVGLFAVGETLFLASRSSSLRDQIIAVKGSLWMTREDWRRSWPAWLRGAAFGFPIGALPAGGAEVPTMLSYATEKRLSKHPEQFGHGAIEGVAGPEAANNASAAGALAPLLALGLPTSATAAILLAAFQQYGLRPGPLLFESNPDLVWGMIASLYIGNVLLLLLNLPLVGIWVRLLTIPKPWLYAGILTFASLGAITLNNNAVDIGLLWVIGMLGFGMRVMSVPIIPCVLGFILGPMLEAMMRRSLGISQGDFSVFVTRPISLTLLLMAAALLIGPIVLKAWRRSSQPVPAQ